MNKISYAVKISPVIRKKIKDFCDSHGIKQGHFVEKALEEKLKREENIEDILELKELAYEEAQAISFEQYLSKRNV